MSRAPRVIVPGVPHHVTQRGNGGQRVFHEAPDYRFYLGLLAKHCAESELRCLGYCLMPNHVHAILVPADERGLSKAVARTHLVHAQYINERMQRTGHLWQARFYSCPMDDAHCWAALRYIETNPVRAGLAAAAWEYPWSSAPVHVGNGHRDPLLRLDEWRDRVEPDEWRQVLGRPDDPSLTERLRDGTRSGRPVGDNGFISRLEARLGRRLRPRRRGRPRK